MAISHYLFKGYHEDIFLTTSAFPLVRPETPLHANGPENESRCYVTRWKMSAGTRSDVGCFVGTHAQYDRVDAAHALGPSSRGTVSEF
jgi:hypothetical protein